MEIKQPILNFVIKNGYDNLFHSIMAFDCELDVSDESGITPLHQSVISSNYPAAEVLLKHGADPTIADKEDICPLLSAMNKNDLRMLELLLKYRPDMCECVDEKNGMTPLHHAVINRNRNMVRLFIESGADIHKTDANKMSPFDYSKLYRYDDIAELIERYINSSQTASP